MIGIYEYLNKVNSSKRKAGGWPGCFDYSFENDICKISLNRSIKGNLRKIDPWGLAFLLELEKQTNKKAKEIIFSAEMTNNVDSQAHFEALKRRLSFLAVNNENINFKLFNNSKEVNLYDINSLFNRPDVELIHQNIDDRSDKDKSGRLEKDFQAFLFGKGLERSGNSKRTNERLAILGIDFFKLKNKELELLREFPTGVFVENISKETRLLPTYFIDIVTFNKYGTLSVIELKLDDSSLEVVSQLLDYALFVRSYRSHIKQILELKFERKINVEKIMCYVANNHFHPKFEEIKRFYNTDNKNYGFQLKQIVLGHSEPFE